MGEPLIRETLPEQIYRILRNDILQLEIPCGTKLTLQALKERFGVSHTPIREALTRLVDDGLVDHYSNVGISVISLSVKDVQEVFKLSYDFDYLAIKYAMDAGMREEFLRALKDNIQTCRQLLEMGDIEKWGAESDNFHLAFYEYADNTRLETAAYKLRAQLTLMYNMNRIETRNHLQIQDYHDRICECLCAGDTEGARQALRAHIHNDMDLAVATILEDD